MRVAIVHDWLTGMRGGERVLEALLEIFPDAELFTLVHVPGSVSERIEARPIHASPLSRLPGIGRRYPYALPLMPRIVERFDLRGFDLLISSSHCVAKGAVPPPGVPHYSYCNTPMRYVWDEYDAYFGPGRARLPVRLAMALLAPRLREWDRRSAANVTAFIANSEHIRRRIRRHYGRDAAVIHPPVDIDRFRPAAERDDFYLCLGALVPYKRPDLVIEAFNRLGRRLVVAGDGPMAARLRRMAGPTVELLGHVADETVADLLGRCRALVHAGVEDFGITLVEAQAAGAPVIAQAAGGALETVVGADAAVDRAPDRAAATAPAVNGPTGVLFEEPTVESLIAAVRRLESSTFHPRDLRASAERFAPDRFAAAFRRFLDAQGAMAVA